MTFSALDSDLLGPLFATPEMRAVFSDRARLAAMLEVETAVARAEADHGMVPAGLATALAVIRADDFDLASLNAATVRAGVPTIPFVKEVQRRLPPDLRAYLHYGATSQDIVDTATVLHIRRALEALLPDLDRTLAALAVLARRHRETPMVGRTYGQHAAPLTFGYKAAVWSIALADVATQLPALRSRVLVASLGGAVGTLAVLGDAGPAIAVSFAQHLGLGAPPVAWHAIRGRIVETGGWLAAMIAALAKLATDVVHLASTEVDELSEAHEAGRGGSTAMPQKRNPVSATVILAAHAAATGHVITLMQSAVVADERGAGPWHAEWHSLPQLFGLAAGALREAARLAESVVVHPDRMGRNLDLTRGLVFAGAAASALTQVMGSDRGDQAMARAIDVVRAGTGTLADALAADEGIPAKARLAVAAAFDLKPAVNAAALWTDRALAVVDKARVQIQPDGGKPHANG